MNEIFELGLEPLQQIKQVGESGQTGPTRWWCSGNDPAWQCHWSQAPRATLAGGWYLLDLAATVHKGRLHNMRLYPGYGHGAVGEVESQPLALSLQKGETGQLRSALVRFVDEVSVLRFDPTVLPCEFSFESPRLRRVGRTEAFRHLWADAWKAAGSLSARLRLMARTAKNIMLGGPARMADAMYRGYMERRTNDAISDYSAWLEFFDPTSELEEEQARIDLAALPHRPEFSIVMPVYNTPEQWLRRCIDSVLAQQYPHWELCIADDASTLPHVREILHAYASSDPRIKVVGRERNGHISAASNSALEQASGDYVALLDHDDELHPLALLECAKGFARNPRWRMLFTDEDKIDQEGKRSDPYFKSDWNRDLFLSQNCVCHLTVYERELVTAAGGFQEDMDGAQDWDLTLRVTEHLDPDQIGHVPKVLYHWRMIEGSTALAPGEKSYAHLAAMRALQNHLDRTATRATVCEMPGYSGYYRIAYQIASPEPLVSLLIPTRDKVDLLRQCVDSILRKTDYPNYEIVILDNGSREPQTLAYLAKAVEDQRIRVVGYDKPFNYSALNNFGAGQARGEVLGLLNNDVEVIGGRWLTEMVSHALRPEIGVVGAMLYYPNDTIQHAGVFLGIGGVAGHAYVGQPRGYPGDKHRAGLAQSLSAVTAACALIRRSVFEEVGGLDEGLQVAFNDVDMCLRVRERGYRNLWTPFAELYHHESASRGYENTPEKIARFKREEAFMKQRWGEALQRDPYYNPNLTLTDTPFSLAYPPR